MSDKPIKGSYIDTQGMSGPTDPNAKLTAEPRESKPATVKPRRMFTSTDVMELKILIHEVLDEREGKFDYTSYFETEKFKHTVIDDEPEYTPHYKPEYYQ